MTPPPGTYRKIFMEALQALKKQDITEEKMGYIEHYIGLLNNPDYKFGKFVNNGNYSSNETIHPFFQ